jgi:predicted DNA-binding transcriptional regulator YafY
MARANTIRILRLLLLEQQGVKDSASQLARRFGVTRRTIMRDRAAMRKAKAGLDLDQEAVSNPGAESKAKNVSKAGRGAVRGGGSAKRSG